MTKELLQNAGFNADLYFEAQTTAFNDRIVSGIPNLVEFGGKPFGDYHASRVLPGYEADVKADIIKCIRDEMGNTRLAFVVNAQDILSDPDGRRSSKRIRGDSQLTYDDEVLRIRDQAAEEFSIEVTDAIVTVVPKNLSEENLAYLGSYYLALGKEFDRVSALPMIEGYPNNIADQSIVAELTSAKQITTDENLIVMSPGGGSGKFGVIVSEIAHYLSMGTVPNFIKFETFPVFNLPPTHGLNRAFLAATADLPNVLAELKNGQTNYDKDVQNLALLKQLLKQFPHLDTTSLDFTEPTDMGINVIEKGIVDDQAVEAACLAEIERRIERYVGEHQRGVEAVETIARTRSYLGALTLNNGLSVATGSD